MLSRPGCRRPLCFSSAVLNTHFPKEKFYRGHLRIKVSMNSLLLAIIYLLPFLWTEIIRHKHKDEYTRTHTQYIPTCRNTRAHLRHFLFKCGITVSPCFVPDLTYLSRSAASIMRPSLSKTVSNLSPLLSQTTSKPRHSASHFLLLSSTFWSYIPPLISRCGG